MPRIDFKLWDRVYILKLICTAQMTYSSFITLVYFYLIILQDWTGWESERPDILKIKWGVIAATVSEFGLGVLLAFAANMRGVRCRKRIIAWLVLETFLVPISICLLTQLYYRIKKSTKKFTTDPHYVRVNIAQVCFLLCQYLFIAYTLDFLVHTEPKPKIYDPSIRPQSVYAPTDPQITTTESRHIRMSQSFLFQPSSSKRTAINDFNDEEASSSSSEIKISQESKKGHNGNGRRKPGEWLRDSKESRENDDEWIKVEDVVWSLNEKNKEKLTWLKNAENPVENLDENELVKEKQEWTVNTLKSQSNDQEKEECTYNVE